MGRRGPKPRPTALKLLDGTRADRINPSEPSPPVGVPEPPEDLDGEALQEWHRMAPMLAAMRVLTAADARALSLYCHHFKRWRDAERTIRRNGMLIPTNTGGLKENPALAIASRSLAEMRRFLAEFGCTPSSRSRVAATPEKKTSKLEQFLAGS